MPKKMLIYFDTNLATGILEEPCLCLGKKTISTRVGCYYPLIDLLFKFYSRVYSACFERIKSLRAFVVFVINNSFL